MPRNRFQVERLQFQFAQCGRGIRFPFDWRNPGERVIEGGAETIDITPKVLRLGIQPFRRDVVGCTPDFSLWIAGLCRRHREAEVTNLGVLVFGKQNIGRFDVTMHKPARMRRLQPPRDFNPDLEHLRFRHPRIQRHQVVETPALHQFHNKVELSVVNPGGKDLHDVRMIDRCRKPGLLFQPRRFGRICAKFPAEDFQRHESVETGITCFVD